MTDPGHHYQMGAAPHPADRHNLLDDADTRDNPDRPDPADLARVDPPVRQARSYAHEDPWLPGNAVGYPAEHVAATRVELARQYQAWLNRRGAA